MTHSPTQRAIDLARAVPLRPAQHLIDGAWVASSDGGALPVTSPIDGSRLTTLADGTAEDVGRVVRAARHAFDKGAWSGQPPAGRKAVMRRWAELVEREAVSLAVLGVRDNGTEIAMALKAEPLSAAGTINWYAEAIDKV